MTRAGFIALLLAAASAALPGCAAPPAVAWADDLPHCPYCRQEVAMHSTACRSCGKEYRWEPTTCSACNGSGTAKCRICAGGRTETVQCPNCGGGIIRRSLSYPSLQWVMGDQTRGTYGKELGPEITRAEWRKISGQHPMWSGPGPGEHYYRCPKCKDGTVVQTCHQCGGTGTVQCSSCEGKGRVGA